MKKTLSSTSPEIEYLCAKDKRLAKVIRMVGEISYSTHDDGYIFLVHEIIEQMLSIKAGAKIFSRLTGLCNGTITPSAILALSIEEITSTGTSRPKATYIKSLTKSVIDGTLDLKNLASKTDYEVISELTSIKGIGMWTAKMYLIFVLDRKDVLPFEDGAFLQSYRWLYKTTNCAPIDIQKRSKKWKRALNTHKLFPNVKAYF